MHSESDRSEDKCENTPKDDNISWFENVKLAIELYSESNNASNRPSNNKSNIIDDYPPTPAKTELFFQKFVLNNGDSVPQKYC
ncbi:hypothetical protein [Nostoc sp.]|uniref:hypothetical protein n=1 Tax=Nostoc sp. TaxID=1180 RepID=UPI002FFC66E8